MSQNSKIEWTDHTWNPWWGCTRVSPGCAHCYAERQASRFGVKWGDKSPRRKASAKVMGEPYKWDAQAKAEGIRRCVFVASMADWCDLEAPDEWRSEMWDVIANCPNLDWLMLTKRPENFNRCLPLGWANERERWGHVGLGVTVENQEQADHRVPILLRTDAAIRFLSCEPLLGPVLLDNGETSWLTCIGPKTDGDECCESMAVQGHHFHGIDWVICGGESGPGSRPMHPDWARSLRDQCAAAGVAFHFKQWGEWLPVNQMTIGEVSEASKKFRLVNQTHFMVGKKSAGRLLDGVEHNEFPVWSA